MSYTPNARNRLKTVVKNYAHEPNVVYDTFQVVGHATGVLEDEVILGVLEEEGFEGSDGGNLRLLLGGLASDDPATWRSVMMLAADHYPKHHRATEVVPWFAWALNKLQTFWKKRQWRNARDFLGEDRYEYARALHTDDQPLVYKAGFSWLWQNAPVIVQWHDQERPQLRDMTLAEVQDALKDFDSSEVVPEQPIEMEFGDGWTIQRLVDDEAVFAEGEAMGNCLQEDQFGPHYCKHIRNNKIDIYSLRSPENKPHVTMEWEKEKERFVQVLGRNNSIPADKYQPYVRAFIESMPGNQKLGLWLLERQGDLAQSTDGAGVDLSGADLSELDFSAREGEKSSFAGADLSNTELYKSSLLEVDLTNADLRGANLTRADLEKADATGADFRRARVEGADMRSYFGMADLRDVVWDALTKWSEEELEWAEHKPSDLVRVRVEIWLERRVNDVYNEFVDYDYDDLLAARDSRAKLEKLFPRPEWIHSEITDAEYEHYIDLIQIALEEWLDDDHEDDDE